MALGPTWNRIKSPVQNGVDRNTPDVAVRWSLADGSI
jgi:hypothetical protein